jgi:hypothetical protein
LTYLAVVDSGRLFGNISKKVIPTQSVTITGLGSTQFLRAVKAVETLHRLFLLKYPDLLPLERGEFDGNPTLTFDSKLMTPAACITSDMEKIELGELDPCGILRKQMFGRRCAYTEENVVKYKRKGIRQVRF